MRIHKKDEGTKFLEAHGFDRNGQPRKPRRPVTTERRQTPFVKIVSTPMGGMTRRNWR